MIASWGVFITTVLESLLDRSRICVTLLSAASSRLPRELGFSWFFLCWVILTYTLDTVNMLSQGSGSCLHLMENIESFAVGPVRVRSWVPICLLWPVLSVSAPFSEPGSAALTCPAVYHVVTGLGPGCSSVCWLSFQSLIHNTGSDPRVHRRWAQVIAVNFRRLPSGVALSALSPRCFLSLVLWSESWGSGYLTLPCAWSRVARSRVAKSRRKQPCCLGTTSPPNRTEASSPQLYGLWVLITCGSAWGLERRQLREEQEISPSLSLQASGFPGTALETEWKAPPRASSVRSPVPSLGFLTGENGRGMECTTCRGRFEVLSSSPLQLLAAAQRPVQLLLWGSWSWELCQWGHGWRGLSTPPSQESELLLSFRRVNTKKKSVYCSYPCSYRFCCS